MATTTTTLRIDLVKGIMNYNQNIKFDESDSCRLNPFLSNWGMTEQGFEHYMNQNKDYPYMVCYDVPFMKQEEVYIPMVRAYEYKNVGMRLGQCVHYHNTLEEALADYEEHIKYTNKHYYNVFIAIRVL